MNVLVTGGAGFVGSNLAVMLKGKHPEYRVTCLDNLSRRGSELNLPRLKEAGIDFVHGDIRNPEDLGFKGIDLVLECSAEPSVLAGFGESPANLINTNLVGTVNCLEMARKSKADFIFLSSSRVYPYDRINSLETEEKETRLEWKPNQGVPGLSGKGIGEGFPLEGIRSMYGATKLCSEYLLQEYVSMYGIRGVINRCGVLTGPWQFGKVDQGIFTLWMLGHHFNRPLKYIGYGGQGKQVRDLLHVRDLFGLLEKQVSDMDRYSGKVFNVGGGNDSSLSLQETTRLCEEITGNSIEIKAENENRPADIPIYITDNSKVTKASGWEPKTRPRKVLEDIHAWIQEREEDIRRTLLV